MDRMQDLKNIESMRKMMLIQEEIFKHQVHELHRLYKLQKYLMQDLQTNASRTDPTINPISFSARCQQQSTGHKRLSKFQDLIPPDHHKEVSGSNMISRMQLPVKLGLPIPSDQKKRINEENDVEVELTLSIGNCSGKKRSKNETDRDQEQLGSSSGKTSNGEEYGESGVDQENTRPPWLLQDLSLNI